MSFLPDGYKVPQSSGKYLKLRQGENRFRILSSAIVGYVGWNEDGGKRTPIRKRVGQAFSTTEVDPDTIKHFWAFFVWNFNEKRVQVFEVTQKKIMGPIAALTRNTNWGDPKGYNIVVDRSGEGLDTEYVVNPEPPQPLPEEAVKSWQEVEGKATLEALFSNGDPFGDEPKHDTNEEIKAADIPF